MDENTGGVSPRPQRGEGGGPQAATPVPIETFAELPSIESPNLSPDGTRVVLTDGRAGHRAGAYLLNPGQIETAVEQHRLTTGESLSADALIEALPWE